MVGWRALTMAGVFLATGVGTYAGLHFVNVENRAVRQTVEIAKAVQTPALQIQVESTPESYPADQWQLLGGFAGWVDVAKYADGGPLAARPSTAADIVELSGWAGDPVLGTKAGQVIAVTCGAVVAAANTGLQRPDVASSIHPNLQQSGWRMAVAIRHLPHCGDDRVTFFATFPPFLFATPMRDPMILTRSAPAGESGGPMPIPAANLPRPQGAPPPVQSLEMRNETALHRCGAENCDIVGRIPRGKRQVVVVDKSGDWTLIVDTEARVGGWLKNQAASIAAPPAR